MDNSNSKHHWRNALKTSEQRIYANEAIRQDPSQVNMQNWIAFTLTATQQKVIEMTKLINSFQKK